MNESELFDHLAERIEQMQVKAQANALKRNPSAVLKRGFHAKGVGVRARFHVRPDLPPQFRIGLFQPNAEYDALVRFSNARGEVLGDLSKDQRGMAIRLKTDPAEPLLPTDQSGIQDFLMTNTPVSFARNPLQFIEVGELLLDGIGVAIPQLVKKYGLTETRRILGVFLSPIISFKPFQMSQYWSRTSYQFGERPARYLIRPAPGAEIWTSGQQLLSVLRAIMRGREFRENYLQENLESALRAGEIHFEFCVQPFVDEKQTPVEAAYIEWKEAISPPIPLALLTIPKQTLDATLEQQMEFMAYNPWNTRDFTPLGQINRARKKVYAASALHRGASVSEQRRG